MAIRLFCATGNRAKLKEFQLAAGGGIEVRALPPLPCPEEGATFEENAAAKALCYSRAGLQKSVSGIDRWAWVFADDSGLVVDALQGDPGVRSARFAGDDADDQANNALLLKKLQGAPPEQRAARFVCWIALARGGKLVKTFQGEVEGRILEQLRGTGGFGYDPLFLYPPAGCTFAEMPPEEKWRHSHRGQAFRRLLDWLRRQSDGSRT